MVMSEGEPVKPPFLAARPVAVTGLGISTAKYLPPAGLRN